MVKIIDFISNSFVVAALIFFATVYYQQWSDFSKRKTDCQLFFFHLRNILNNNSFLLESIKPIRDFDDFSPNDELDLYSPKIIKEYDPRDVIFYFVFFRSKKSRDILSEKYYTLESAITFYIESANIIIESEDEYNEILDKDSLFFNGMNSQKKEFVKDYNEAIIDVKVQHDKILEVLDEIDSFPFKRHKYYPFA
jgi:hypothetical protein